MTNQLYLKPDEGKFLGMAVASTLELVEEHSKNPAIPWTPESRKDLKDMLESGRRLKAKLEKLGFDVRPLPDLEPGEENDYLTKES
jgi:hypothetical protein